MGTLTIRNVDEGTHALLRARAASHGRSVESEVRSILAAAVDSPDRNLLLELHDRLGGDGVELEIAARTELPREVPLP